MPNITTCDTNCATTAINTNIPGDSGQSAFTLTTTNIITLPAVGQPVTVTVGNTDWIAKGETVFVSDGTNWAHITVTNVTNTTEFTGTFLGYIGDSVETDPIAIGAKVVASGTQSAAFDTTELAALNVTLLTGIAGLALPSGATASDTLSDGVGISDWLFYVSLPNITAADLIGQFIPGYAFRILKLDFLHELAVTTGSKAATLTPKIAGSAITGGVLSLSNTYAAGAVTAGSAVGATQDGTSAEAFSITASAVTTFIEGNGVIRVRVQNLDTLNAIASLGDKINDIRTALIT